MLLSQIITFLENRIAPRTYALKNDIYGTQFGQKLKDRNIKGIMLEYNRDFIKNYYKKAFDLLKETLNF